MKLRSEKQTLKDSISLKCDTTKKSAKVSKVKGKRKKSCGGMNVIGSETARRWLSEDGGEGHLKCTAVAASSVVSKTAVLRRCGQCSSLPTALTDQSIVSPDSAFTNDSMNFHHTSLTVGSVSLGSSSNGNVTDLSSRHFSYCAKTSQSNGINAGCTLQVYGPNLIDVTKTRNKEEQFKTNAWSVIDGTADKISERVEMRDEGSIPLLKIPCVKQRNQDILVGTSCQNINDSLAAPTDNNQASAQEDDSCSVISLGSDSEVIILDSDPIPQLDCSSTSDVVVIDTVYSAKCIPTDVAVDSCSPLRQSNKFEPCEFTTQKSAGCTQVDCSGTSDVVVIDTVSSAKCVPSSDVTVDPRSPLRQLNKFEPREFTTRRIVDHTQLDWSRTSDVVVIDTVSSAKHVKTSDVVTLDPCTPLRQSNKFQIHEVTTRKIVGCTQLDCSRTSDVVVIDMVSSAKNVPISDVVTVDPCTPLRQSKKFQPHVFKTQKSVGRTEVDCSRTIVVVDKESSAKHVPMSDVVTSGPCTHLRQSNKATQKSISCSVRKKMKKVKQQLKAVPEDDVSVLGNVLQTVQNKPNCLSSVRKLNLWPDIVPVATTASASSDCAPGSKSGVGLMQQGHAITAISSAVGYNQEHVTSTPSAGVHCDGLQHWNNNSVRVGLQPISNRGDPTSAPYASLYGTNLYNPNPDPVRSGLRPIIIDGSNVAMGHSNGRIFSCKGLKICIDYFLKRLHKVVAFVPQFRKSSYHSLDTEILDDLEKKGLVSFTPSRKIGKRLVVPYDDRYIVQYAAECGGVIVSTDNYRDLLQENPAWRETIENRLLMFTWVGDVLMFPQDPLGRYGPNLNRFLRFP